MSVHKGLRRAFVAIGGGLLVLVGLAGFVLPILPGTVLLVGGLLLWSSEFRWAREVLARVRSWLADLSAKRQDRRSSRSRHRRDGRGHTSG